MKDIFKEQLHDYQSPLSNRLSFDKVIAQTNKQSKPIWLNPKVIASAGLFLVVGTAIVAYYATGNSSTGEARLKDTPSISQIGHNQTNSNNTVDAEELIGSKETAQSSIASITQNSELPAIVNHNKHNEKVIGFGAQENATNKQNKSQIKTNDKTINSVSSKDIGTSDAVTNTSKLGQDQNLANTDNITVISTTNSQEGDFSYTKQEIVIGGSSTQNYTSKNTNTGAEPSVIYSTQSIDLNTGTEKPELDQEKEISQSDENTPSKWMVETNLLSNARGINSNVSAVALFGNHRTFGGNAIFLLGVNQKLNIGLGFGFDAQSNIGKAEWSSIENNQQITSRQIVIVQPGLPNIVQTVYDTTNHQNKVNNVLNLEYNAQIFSLPIAIRYNIGQWNEFGLWLSNTAQPGIITSGLGHVFGNSEWNTKVQNTQNSFVLLNRTGLRLTYDLGKRQSFILEPNMTLQWNNNKNLNTNPISQYGVGVGILFKL